jgi:tetratricopeptide (TPR) repeat protein
MLLAADSIVEDAKKKIKEGKYDEAIAALDAEHKAKPKSPEVTKALVDAHMAYGDFNLNNQQMPPFRKYPAALREYRKVVELDKTNKKANENIAMIEGIYKQMGRPVPK